MAKNNILALFSQNPYAGLTMPAACRPIVEAREYVKRSGDAA